MGLTSEQNLETKPVAKEPWTIKRLFPAKELANAIAKKFNSPVEVMAAFLMIVFGISILIGRQISWMFYLLLIITVFVVFIERASIKAETKKDTKV